MHLLQDKQRISKVTNYLDIEHQYSSSISEKDLLSTALATEGRVSELHSRVREEEFCRLTETSSLMIKPHSSFLDMHGMRKRLEPREVKTLKNPEGNISNICSATALQEYLRHPPTQEKDVFSFIQKRTKAYLSSN